jgi:hypothetical protein
MWLALLFIFFFSFYFFESTIKKEEVKEEVKEVEEVVEVKEVKLERYENKYLEKSKQIEKKQLTNEQLEKLTTSLLLEKTPLGNVLMFYNNKKESFCYYSDHNIPYYFLEPIARKYIIMFDCAILYVFLDEELEKIKEEEKKEEEQEEKKYCIFEKKKEEKDCRVFAKFKNYNKGNSMQSTKTSPLKQHKVQPINMKNIPIKARTNRYTYEGKLMNFSFLQKVNKKDNISYSDFKRTLIK